MTDVKEGGDQRRRVRKIRLATLLGLVADTTVKAALGEALWRGLLIVVEVVRRSIG